MEDDYQQPKPTLSIASLLKVPTRKPSKIVNERQSLLALALENINTERVGTIYKPMTGKGIAMKVAHVSTDELRDFVFLCEKSKNGFGKCFFGRLK